MKEKLFDIGLAIILYIWMVIFVCTVSLICKIPITAVHNILAIIVTSIIIYFFNKKIKATAIIILSFLAIFVFSLVMSAWVYDFSWDGNDYHMTMAGTIKDGWNPVYESFEEGTLKSNITDSERGYWAWYNGYTKGTEIFGASVYALTGNIEMGKCFTLLSMFAVVLIIGSLLYSSGRFKKYQAIIVGLILAVNPVTLPQMHSTYVDGFLGMILFIMIAAEIYLLLIPPKENQNTGPHHISQYKLRCLLLLFLCAGIIINIKLSGLVYVGAYAFVFFVFWLIRLFMGDQRNKWRKVIQFTVFCMITMVISVCVLGATSFVRNTAVYKSPFYPLAGSNKTDFDIVDDMLASSYVPMSHIERFVRSTFSAVNNTIVNEWGDQPHIKIPFTVLKTEFGFKGYDIRISGWGIFFSGILLISIGVISWKLWKWLRMYMRQRKRIKKSESSLNSGYSSVKVKGNFVSDCEFSTKVAGDVIIVPIIICLALATFVPVFFVPALCWARYFMQYFLVPAAALIVLFMKDSGDIKDIKGVDDTRNAGAGRIVRNSIGILLTLILAANCYPMILRFNERIEISNQTRKDLAHLKELTENEVVEISLPASYIHQGVLFHLRDLGITDYILVTESEGTELTFYGYLGYRVKND